MAAAAKMDCYCCGETVAVRLNRASRAYYHCGHCGLSVVSKDSDSTDRMLNKNVIPTNATPHNDHTKPTPPAKPAKPSAEPVVPQPSAAPLAKKSAFKTLMDT